MKRSDMVDKLSIYFQSEFGETVPDAEISADRFLHWAEELGMIPPGYVIDGSAAGVKSIAIPGWEREDEDV